MKRLTAIILTIGLVGVVLFPRVLDLDAFRSPDEDRWIANTSGFTMKLAHGQLAELVRQPHPGITTQWLGALAIRADDWALKKLPLVIGQSLLIFLAGYVFGRLWGRMAGVFVILTLATNPLLYAHTRVYAMDSLLALFSLLALGFLLLWHHQKQAGAATRYLIASAFCAAAAILSKLPGVALIPIIGATLLYWAWQEARFKNRLVVSRQWLVVSGVWLLAFIISFALILPSFAIAPNNVIGDFQEFFRSDDYQELHQLGPFYYLRTLAFFSTPLQWVALIGMAWLATKKKIPRLNGEQLIILLSFAVLLIIQMTLGAKKGDRYILPSFVILDGVAALVITKIYQLFTTSSHTNPAKLDTLSLDKERVAKPGEVNKGYLLHATYYLLLATLVWQFIIIWQTHPHTLAYVNPVTRSWFGERRHGWGEGLDLAAAYLNTKPTAADLKVATYYPQEFAPYFDGESVPAHQHDNENVDYVIIYRGMFERGPDAWETDVVNAYRNKRPEKVISIGGLPMVWIYSRQTSAD